MRDRQGGFMGATVTPTTTSASGVWTLREAMRFQRGGTWPVAATAPGTPTSVSGSAGNAQVALTWTAPASNGGSAITGYVVEYTPSGGSASTVSTGSASASYTVTGLTNGTAYTFRVAAVNAIGTGSYSTASASFTPNSFTPTAVLLASGTSYTVPTGATSMKAWAVGAGSNRNQAGAVVYKTWSVTGGSTVSYMVGPAPGSNVGDWYLSGKSSVTYGGSTIYAEGGRVGANAASTPAYGGGDGGTTSATLPTIGQTRYSPSIGGVLTSPTSPCKRRPATDVSGLLAAVNMAGGKTIEDCNLATAAFGSGSVDDKFGTNYPSGYGGGGSIDYGNKAGAAASGAVVLYFQ